MNSKRREVVKLRPEKLRELPEDLEAGWIELLQGPDASDEYCAMRLIFWSEVEALIAEEGSSDQTAIPFRRWWLEKSISAIWTDSDFFRRVALLLERERKEPRQNRAPYFAYLAYMRLYQDPANDPEQITKHQVKTLAQRWWAFRRLNHAYTITRFEEKFGDERDDLIEREIRLLPTQRWQDIWKLPGFAKLKDAPRGAKAKNCRRRIVDKIHN
jgi:hypothetical protein